MHPGALLALAPGHATAGRAIRFEAVFAAHSTTVYSYARRRATKEEAEDVVAETFLVVWRRLDDVPAEPLPWPIGVARRILANRRRGERRRAALDERLHHHPALAAQPDPADPPGIPERVVAALATLPAGEREVIELIAWEGLSPAEVAVALGTARATVNVGLHRARQRLAQLLEETR